MVLTTAADAEAIRDIFAFVQDDCELTIERALNQATGTPAPVIVPSGQSVPDRLIRVPADKLDQPVNPAGEPVTNPGQGNLRKTGMVETQIEPGAQTVLLATLFVRDALCALDASGVQEVIRVESVTRGRHAPEEVAGVMNLRGKIVTLLDLGMILGFGKSAITRESRVFIMEDRNEFLGVLVDRVGEVIEVEPGQRDSLPVNFPAAQARYFQGICRAGGHVIAILNPREVLNESRP